MAKCVVIDEQNELVINAGITINKQYGQWEDRKPGQNLEHGMGMVYANDMKGNWKWGKYYKTFSMDKQSYISDIQKCKMIIPNVMAFLGQEAKKNQTQDDQSTVLVLLNTKNGEIFKYMKV